MGLLVRLIRLGALCSAIFATVCCALPASAATYFVANSGSDDNAGTDISAPLKTLQRAALSLAPGDTCLIREGIYRETLVPRSSGTSNAPITFAAYANEKVIISGADPVTNWIASSHGIFMTKVGSVLPNGRNEVFADGTMIPQARHPQHGNGGLLHPATLDLQIDGQNSNVIASSAFGGHRSNFWAGAWFYGGVGDKWSWQCARVLSSSGNTITVDESTKSQPWFTGDGVGYLSGPMKTLPPENEWLLQLLRGENWLCLRLGGRSGPGSHNVEIKRREWCVDINGQNYITVHGLWLQAGAVRLHGWGNILEDCNATFLSHFEHFKSGYAFDGGFPAGGGVVIKGNRNIVRQCVIGNTAGSGIISTGDNNVLTRNVIYNTDYSGTYACAIRLNGRHNQVAFNTAHHSGRDILQPGGAGHDIIFNDFSQPGQMCRDLGVIYIWGTNGRIPGSRRTRIAYNWIHDNLGALGACPLVYLDNYCRNFVVDHNVIWDCIEDAGIRINGPASGHLLYNNTLFNCENIGVRTYNMWPDNNPAPTFWTRNLYGYSSANNLFIAGPPNAYLRNWLRLDFRPLATTAAAVSGRIIPGYTEIASGVLSQGAYESNLQWTAGVNGVGLAPSVLKLEATSNSDTPPKLCVHQTTDNLLTITAPPAAEAYQLYVTTNLHPPVVWFAVTNVPSVSSTQWSVALPVSQDSQRWFCLQSKN